MFDDGAGPTREEYKQSRAIQISLDTQHDRRRSSRLYTHSPPLSSNFEGGIRRCPKGDVFVDWGQKQYFTEYRQQRPDRLRRALEHVHAELSALTGCRGAAKPPTSPRWR